MEERRTLDPDAWRFEPSPRSLKAQLTMGACLAAECPSLPHVNGLSTRARWWREGANSVDNATATLWTVVAAGGGAVLAGLVSSVVTYLVIKRNLSERVREAADRRTFESTESAAQREFDREERRLEHLERATSTR